MTASKKLKKINDQRFDLVKQYINKNGVKAAEDHFGYSLRTLNSIQKAGDYTSWREKRRGSQPKIQSVAPSQSVTTELKKPGHALVVAPIPAPKASNTVTREEFERVMSNNLGQIKTLKRQVESLREDLDTLLKEDSAYKGVEILLEDRVANSLWERAKRALKGGQR